jgi:hypothetical protein
VNCGSTGSIWTSGMFGIENYPRNLDSRFQSWSFFISRVLGPCPRFEMNCCAFGAGDVLGRCTSFCMSRGVFGIRASSFSEHPCHPWLSRLLPIRVHSCYIRLPRRLVTSELQRRWKPRAQAGGLLRKNRKNFACSRWSKSNTSS